MLFTFHSKNLILLKLNIVIRSVWNPLNSFEKSHIHTLLLNLPVTNYLQNIFDWLKCCLITLQDFHFNVKIAAKNKYSKLTFLETS